MIAEPLSAGASHDTVAEVPSTPTEGAAGAAGTPISTPSVSSTNGANAIQSTSGAIAYPSRTTWSCWLVRSSMTIVCFVLPNVTAPSAVVRFSGITASQKLVAV